MTDARAIPSEYAGLGSQPRDVPATLADIETLSRGLVSLADQVAAIVGATLAVGRALEVDCALLEARGRDVTPLTNVRARLLALEGANAGVEKILKSIHDAKTAAKTGRAQEVVKQSGPRSSPEDIAHYQALQEQGNHGRR